MQLFNNRNAKIPSASKCSRKACKCCDNACFIMPSITSTTTSRTYKLPSLRCNDAGIYAIKCQRCHQQYIGKTTTSFAKRFTEHFQKSSKSAVKEHLAACTAKSHENFEMSFLESMHNRGKFTLSEREYLWNQRLKGSINIQKTLMD